MPLFADGSFQLFHQRDTRRPGPFGEPFGWALSRTADFVTYTDLGEVLERGGDEAQDQFVFAGSVLDRGDHPDGRFVAMYTGYNRDYAIQGRAAQVLMRATSDDLLHWHRDDRALVVPQPGYDPDDWRDPFVLRDPDHDRWIMILGARLAGDPVRTGRTVWFTSTDLTEWHFEGDFWAPDLYSMHEMPDLFRIGDWWYLLTTEYSDRSRTIYRMAPDLSGPWQAPADDSFDGRTYYAARSAADDAGRRYLFGWVPTKEGEVDLGAQQWGGTLLVHEVVQRDDGSLGVGIPDPVLAAFTEVGELEPRRVARADGRTEAALATAPGSTWLAELLVRIEPGTRAVSLRLAVDPDTGDGYGYTLHPNRMEFDRQPNQPWFRYDNRGHERPLPELTDREVRLRLLVDDTIATLYVDDVALSARIDEPAGDTLVLEVVDGAVTVLSGSLRRFDR